MKNSKTWWFLISILIIAIFLRFYHFTTTPPGLYLDEAIDGNNAAEAAQTGHYQPFYIEDNGREGLYVNIVAAMFQFFHAPHEPWVIRLPAAAAGVATVFGLFLLVAELFGNGPGLLASFFLATSFWHIDFSRIGFRAILAPLLLTWSLWLLIRAFKATSQRVAIWWAIVAGIVYGLGFYTYIAYRITPLLFLLFIPFFRKYADFWKRVLIFIVLVFVVAAPIGWYFAKHPSDFFGRTSEIAITNSGSPLREFVTNIGTELLMLNLHGDDNWRHNVSGAPELFFPVGILFLVGVVLGLSWLWKNRPQWQEKDLTMFAWLATYAWFFLSIIPAAASDEGIPHALRSILMLPPSLIFAAVGGIWLYDMVRIWWSGAAAKALAAVLLIIVTFFAYVDYFFIWAENPNVAGAFNADYVVIGREINALPASMPKYVVVEAGGVMTRGIPMSAETTIFITDTFRPAQQVAKNVHYLLPDETSLIPTGAALKEVFHIR